MRALSLLPIACVFALNASAATPSSDLPVSTQNPDQPTSVSINGLPQIPAGLWLDTTHNPGLGQTFALVGPDNDFYGLWSYGRSKSRIYATLIPNEKQELTGQYIHSNGAPFNNNLTLSGSLKNGTLDVTVPSQDPDRHGGKDPGSLGGTFNLLPYHELSPKLARITSVAGNYAKASNPKSFDASDSTAMALSINAYGIIDGRAAFKRGTESYYCSISGKVSLLSDENAKYVWINNLYKVTLFVDKPDLNGECKPSRRAQIGYGAIIDKMHGQKQFAFATRSPFATDDGQLESTAEILDQQ